MPTVSNAKFALFTWVQARLAEKANLTDAVALAGGTDLPQSPATTAFQGTANVAARADHIHPKGFRGPTMILPSGVLANDRAVPLGYGDSTTRCTPTVNVAQLTPYVISTPNRSPLHIVKFGLVGVATAATTGGTVRFGLYSSDPVTGQPTTLLLDSGEVDATTTGYKEFTPTAPLDLPEGLYWGIMVAHVAAPTVEAQSVNLNPVRMVQWDLGNTPTGAKNTQVTGVTGALPATLTQSNFSTSNATAPLHYVKIV